MDENELFMKPTRSIIGDSLYTKYVELQRKTIIDDGEGDEHNLLIEDEDYEAIFQLQFSTPKWPVIQSATYYAPSTNGSFHQEFDLGKRKDPMERVNLPRSDDSDLKLNVYILDLY
ncbi:hypothetical protein Goshw_010097 [Gossypium schwendimanii]|uniref:Uncharacterized protein n=1 Tax=Gossypium schwendimanii TaxID=34291 RepID=A0A7J9KKH4_GOSSC|nr:hypothetical protein [Gossypium schwendimanii]